MKKTLLSLGAACLVAFGVFSSFDYSTEFTIRLHQPLIKSSLNSGIQSITRLSYLHAKDEKIVKVEATAR